MSSAYKYILQQFQQRNVSLTEIAQLAINYQCLYSSVPAIKTAEKLLEKIMQKPQVSENLLVCFALENSQLSEPLVQIYHNENVTNALLLQIADVFGTIGISNYFEIKLNHPELINFPTNEKTTAIVLALAAALSGKLAQLDS
ncbi:hypothetical protein [Fructilactobacillus frigidiflavus]|uniref:hypothetical protein n=1 Tax=Fructilactobacillus frigidiflavus TaxID=3242688 RepID=UPI003757252F